MQHEIILFPDTSETPETFILVADDDETTPSENAHIPAELHIYKQGRHGFGLGKTRGVISGLTQLCEEWLTGIRNNPSAAKM